jgi:hypothetical protein
MKLSFVQAAITGFFIQLATVCVIGGFLVEVTDVPRSILAVLGIGYPIYSAAMISYRSYRSYRTVLLVAKMAENITNAKRKKEFMKGYNKKDEEK